MQQTLPSANQMCSERPVWVGCSEPRKSPLRRKRSNGIGRDPKRRLLAPLTAQPGQFWELSRAAAAMTDQVPARTPYSRPLQSNVRRAIESCDHGLASDLSTGTLCDDGRLSGGRTTRPPRSIHRSSSCRTGRRATSAPRSDCTAVPACAAVRLRRADAARLLPAGKTRTPNHAERLSQARGGPRDTLPGRA